MFSVNLHEFKPIQALDCINLNMIIHKYELLPGLIGAEDIKAIYKNIEALSNSAFVMKGHFEGVVIFAENLKEAESRLYVVINDLLKHKLTLGSHEVSF